MAGVLLKPTDFRENCKGWIQAMEQGTEEGGDLNFRVLRRTQRKSVNSRRKLTSPILEFHSTEHRFEPRLTIYQLQDLIMYKFQISLRISTISKNLHDLFRLKLNRYVLSTMNTETNQLKKKPLFTRMKCSLMQALLSFTKLRQMPICSVGASTQGPDLVNEQL